MPTRYYASAPQSKHHHIWHNVQQMILYHCTPFTGPPLLPLTRWRAADVLHHQPAEVSCYYRVSFTNACRTNEAASFSNKTQHLYGKRSSHLSSACNLGNLQACRYSSMHPSKVPEIYQRSGSLRKKNDIVSICLHPANSSLQS